MKPQMKKNMSRLGGKGKGLSLEAFANAKTKNHHYNPALLKKQREFYKNAKYVSKFKKSLKQENEGKYPQSSRSSENAEEAEEAGEMSRKSNYQGKKKSGRSLNELYEKKREEAENARREKEAIFQAKKEAREKAEHRRKDLKGKMMKKTRFGQPVMKYRIEHLLETIQASTS